jgi:Tfp pilus assembly protein PilX
MSRRARDESGFVLITAVTLLTVILGLGLGLLLFTDNQQRASTREQTSEAAFNLAESALNAQILQLSRRWPTSEATVPPGGTPAGICTPETTEAKNYCPEVANLTAAYPNTGSTACPGTEAWGAPLTNKWTTYVREDVEGSPYFNSTVEKQAATYDKPAKGSRRGIGKVWVRAVGVYNCHVATVVSLVSAQYVHANFPEGAISANWFKITNSGKGKEEEKDIINRQGKAAKGPGKVAVRCNGVAGSACEEYKKGKEQIFPELNPAEEAANPAKTLTSEQLEAVKAMAEAEGHYFAAGKCPSNLEELAGRPVYIEGPCQLAFKGAEVANSEEAPGFLVIANGTIAFGGKTEFYGIVYAANEQDWSGPVVRLEGNTHVSGELVIDGNGGVEFGSSHKFNLEYNPAGAENFETYAGAAGTRNSFRVLPSGQ